MDKITTRITSDSGFEVVAQYGHMTVIDLDTGYRYGDYKMTRGSEEFEMAEMAEAIKAHFAAGGTMGNYQW